MIGLTLRGFGAAQAALRPNRHRGAARRRDDRRHLRADGPDAERIHRARAFGLQRTSTSRSPRRTSFTSQFSAAAPLSDSLVAKVARSSRRGQGRGSALGAWSARDRRRAQAVHGRRRDDHHGGAVASSSAPRRTSTGACRSAPARSRSSATRRRSGDLDPGDRLGIASRGGVEPVTVVGTYEVGSADAGGTDVVSAPLEDIQRWFDRPGEVTTINVAAEDGVAPAELVRRIRRVVPPELRCAPEMPQPTRPPQTSTSRSAAS